MRLARTRGPDGAVRAVVLRDGLATPVAVGEDVSLVDLAMRRREPEPVGDPVPESELTWLTPVVPTSARDFMAFEAHLANAVRAQGGEVDPGWYERPCFYFTNTASITGHGDPVRRPSGVKLLDYELEVACVIGAEVADMDPEDPEWLDVVAGFTLMNDWSARDLQGRDQKQNLGPGKGKDFALSLGPALVTPDEFEDAKSGRPRASLHARVNGETWSSGELGDIHFTWPQILAHASENTRLLPGDVIGSGTCGSGCILELRLMGERRAHWLRPGDVVELEAEHIGVLANTVVEVDRETDTDERTGR